MQPRQLIAPVSINPTTSHCRILKGLSQEIHKGHPKHNHNHFRAQLAEPYFEIWGVPLDEASNAPHSGTQRRHKDFISFTINGRFDATSDATIFRETLVVVVFGPSLSSLRTTAGTAHCRGRQDYMCISRELEVQV